MIELLKAIGIIAFCLASVYAMLCLIVIGTPRNVKLRVVTLGMLAFFAYLFAFSWIMGSYIAR